MPTDAKPLKIGVLGRTTFDKFVKVEYREKPNENRYDGFCIQIFYKAEWLSLSGTLAGLVASSDEGSLTGSCILSRCSGVYLSSKPSLANDYGAGASDDGADSAGAMVLEP
ncbi:hypothetical protein CJ030_MR0G006656 [Morella rubra]|uniref:Uncharacterized protein n=1 Tax=Morella rubra TaxID=262757 RepID=A0A6A1UK79_9ROSI|nr:hypothetical protein CJ030_MR0G006656 [Morella rubra]